MSQPNSPMFVGWSDKLPMGLGRFLALTAASLIGSAALLAVLLGGSVDDPGGGDFQWAAGEQVLHGTVTAEPYPLLHLPPDAAHPLGHTVLLSGEGKQGVLVSAAPQGRAAEARGIMIKRGKLDMLQVGSLTIPDSTPPPAAPVARPLGRWRITGEICDGKCYAGAMRPGLGLAHKACANLCLSGGIPPVFVTTSPVDGSSFLLVGDARGGPLPDSVRDLVAVRVELEGALERRGDLLVFLVDLTTARRL